MCRVFGRPPRLRPAAPLPRRDTPSSPALARWTAVSAMLHRQVGYLMRRLLANDLALLLAAGLGGCTYPTSSSSLGSSSEFSRLRAPERAKHVSPRGHGGGGGGGGGGVGYGSLACCAWWQLPSPQWAPSCYGQAPVPVEEQVGSASQGGTGGPGRGGGANAAGWPCSPPRQIRRHHHRSS